MTPDSSHKKDGDIMEDSSTTGSVYKNGAGNSSVPPKENAASPGRRMVPYLLLTAAVELCLPWLLRAVDARDVPVLTGLFYPFLILPLSTFLSAHAAGRRCPCPWPWVLLYAVLCGLLTVPNVFLLYNYTALFHFWTAAIAALLGGLLGCLRRKIKS